MLIVVLIVYEPFHIHNLKKSFNTIIIQFNFSLFFFAFVILLSRSEAKVLTDQQKQYKHNKCQLHKRILTWILKIHLIRYESLTQTGTVRQKAQKEKFRATSFCICNRE